MCYRNWALKESFIEAIGVGLGFELQTLEFAISSLNLETGHFYKETHLSLDGKDEKEWVLEESKIDEPNLVAVALRKQMGPDIGMLHLKMILNHPGAIHY